MLSSEDETSEAALREAIVEFGRVCYERRLMTSNDGNLSARMGTDRVLITPSGISKGRMRAEQLLLINLEGQVVGEPAGGSPSSETPMHLEVYRQRADVRAVIHAHPVFATVLTVAGLDFPNDVLPETALLLGTVPVTEFALPSTAGGAGAIQPFIRTHNTILLKQHGALSCGQDLESALLNLERLEHAAEVFWRARALGHVEHLTPEILARLRALRDRAPQE